MITRLVAARKTLAALLIALGLFAVACGGVRHSPTTPNGHVYPRNRNAYFGRPSLSSQWYTRR